MEILTLNNNFKWNSQWNEPGPKISHLLTINSTQESTFFKTTVLIGHKAIHLFIFIGYILRTETSMYVSKTM
jgi:hypothetical protein